MLKKYPGFEKHPGPRVAVETVAMAVFLDLLDRIASKLEDGEDPAVLAQHIRIIIKAAENQ